MSEQQTRSEASATGRYQSRNHQFSYGTVRSCLDTLTTDRLCLCTAAVAYRPAARRPRVWPESRHSVGSSKC